MWCPWWVSKFLTSNVEWSPIWCWLHSMWRWWIPAKSPKAGVFVEMLTGETGFWSVEVQLRICMGMGYALLDRKVIYGMFTRLTGYWPTAILIVSTKHPVTCATIPNRRLDHRQALDHDTCVTSMCSIVCKIWNIDAACAEIASQSPKSDGNIVRSRQLVDQCRSPVYVSTIRLGLVTSDHGDPFTHGWTNCSRLDLIRIFNCSIAMGHGSMFWLARLAVFHQQLTDHARWSHINLPRLSRDLP